MGQRECACVSLVCLSLSLSVSLFGYVCVIYALDVQCHKWGRICQKEISRAGTFNLPLIHVPVPGTQIIEWLGTNLISKNLITMYQWYINCQVPTSNRGFSQYLLVICSVELISIHRLSSIITRCVSDVDWNFRKFCTSVLLHQLILPSFFGGLYRWHQRNHPRPHGGKANLPN